MNMSSSTERWLEKYMKRLMGRTEIEDALRRLDKLTHEEARMAAVQVLKVTHTVDAGVRAVDDKLAEVMDGTQSMFSKIAKPFDPDSSRWKTGEVGHAKNF